MKKIIAAFISSIFIISAIFAQTTVSSQGHNEDVTYIAPCNNENQEDPFFWTGGKDGFLIKWNINNDQGYHYQVSDYEIKMVAVAPNNRDIAVYESDGGAVNRLSVWDWTTCTRKYVKRFRDSITSLSFSAKGTYIICGTASVDGTVFIKTLGGQVVDLIRTPTGIVSYALTSDTEKNAAMYSPSGNLSYYDISAGGKLKAKIGVTQGLHQSVLIGNMTMLAGINENVIYIHAATNGKLISKVAATNPMILSSKNDDNLYYLEDNNLGTYTLKVIEKIDNKTLSQPKVLKTFKGPRGKTAITTGKKLGYRIILGGKDGAIYINNIDMSETPIILNSFSQNNYDMILDMAPYNSDFYFLTASKLYQSSYDSGRVNGLGANPGGNRIIPYNDDVILWTKDSKENIILFDYKNQKNEVLYAPKSSVQMVRIFDDKMVIIESNSLVNIYDFASKTLENVYTGAGIQDAVICSDGKLYVAKSYATEPRSPLICVDPVTKETVPMKVSGNVAFGLSTKDKDIYLVCVQSDRSSKKTVVEKYNTSTNITTPILRISEEDSNAFTYLEYPVLYTNIGKENIRSCNLLKKKNFSFNRGASIPFKIAQNGNRVVILNKDGSISWYNATMSQIVANWYLTTEGDWYEI